MFLLLSSLDASFIFSKNGKRCGVCKAYVSNIVFKNEMLTRVNKGGQFFRQSAFGETMIFW